MDPFKLEYNQKDVPMPRFGKTALELLDSRDDEPKSIFNKYGIKIYGGLVGSSFHAGTNWVYNRPMIAGKLLSIIIISFSTSFERFIQTVYILIHAGIHMFGVWFAVGWTVTHFVQKWRQGLAAERDAVMRHYIQTHPEDFISPRELNLPISHQNNNFIIAN